MFVDAGIYIAKALAAEGMHVALAARSTADLNRVVRGIRGSAGYVVAVPPDATNRNDLENLVSKVELEFGAVDVFVKNIVQEFSIKLLLKRFIYTVFWIHEEIYQISFRKDSFAKISYVAKKILC